MVFGDGVVPAESSTAGDWIGPALSGRPGTVGALVPGGYSSLVQVRAPAPSRGWWDRYRDVFALVAAVGERHTTTPERAWLAIWEGHGFANASSRVAWRDPPADEAERLARAAERERVRVEGERRNAAIREALAPIARFELPHRTYYLAKGTVDAVATLRYPGFDGWRNPDLFWPDDRSWFVATDVDVWSLYMGGTDAFVAELAAEDGLDTEGVTTETMLALED